jgi:signal transduction histidine kinase
MDAGVQIVYPRRREKMLSSPEWQPLHRYISELDWEDFVCTPLIIRGHAVGVLNVYMAPNFHAGPTTLEFFTAMADQASLAVDYSTLLERDRIAVRREERKRLARNLHDSVVQQVFSIGMQARALKRAGSKAPEPLDEKLTSMADEITELSKAIQRDLRGIVLALQPSISAEIGLEGALMLLVGEISRRTDVRIDLVIDPEFPEYEADFVEDVYQVVSESIHNAVKHGAPASVRVSLTCSNTPRTATIDVVDDGIGPGDLTSASGGYGLTSMRERAARWAGHIQVAANDAGRGTHVRALLVPPRESMPRGQLT